VEPEHHAIVGLDRSIRNKRRESTETSWNSALDVLSWLRTTSPETKAATNEQAESARKDQRTAKPAASLLVMSLAGPGVLTFAFETLGEFDRIHTATTNLPQSETCLQPTIRDECS
jgi:hypothetical protein